MHQKVPSESASFQSPSSKSIKSKSHFVSIFIFLLSVCFFFYGVMCRRAFALITDCDIKMIRFHLLSTPLRCLQRKCFCCCIRSFHENLIKSKAKSRKQIYSAYNTRDCPIDKHFSKFCC